MAKSGSTRSELNGFLDSRSRIEGTLHFEDTFRVEGEIQGGVRSDGDLVIGENATVDGDVRVGSLYVRGTVKGKVVASRRVELAPGCQAMADVQSPVLLVEEGARFEGSSTMEPASKETKVTKMPRSG